jgi:hypothetical protein
MTCLRNAIGSYQSFLGAFLCNAIHKMGNPFQSIRRCLWISLMPWLVMAKVEVETSNCIDCTAREVY